MTRPTRACIDLRALQHNFRQVQQAAPRSRIMAIIKANAYGHGLVRVAQSLAEADAFGVVTPEEGVALREAGLDQRIVLLEGFFSSEDLAIVSGYRLDVVIHHNSQLELLQKSRLLQPFDVWLKLNTGMNRLGFEPQAATDLAQGLCDLDQVATVRYMTHFACADENGSDMTGEQAARFNRALETLEGERTLANSAAIVAWPDTHADWVRPGIMLYGATPVNSQTAAALDLQPVMTLKTRLIAINTCRQGETVGYGGDWRCPEDMSVGVAAIGYGDGYPRHAGDGMPVLVDGKRAGLVGRVSMDMICIDLRGHDHARVGSEVILWGEGLSVEEIAVGAGTISYELLCGISSRVVLEYHD